jgi:hypothetical protein
MSDDEGTAVEEPTAEELTAKLEKVEKSRRETQSKADSKDAAINKLQTELANLKEADAQRNKVRILEMSDSDAGKLAKQQLNREPTAAEMRTTVETEVTTKLLLDLRRDPDFAAMSKEEWGDFVDTFEQPSDIPLKVAEHKANIALEKAGLNVSTQDRVNNTEDRNSNEEVPDVKGVGANPLPKLTRARIAKMTAAQLMKYPRKERLEVLSS